MHASKSVYIPLDTFPPTVSRTCDQTRFSVSSTVVSDWQMDHELLWYIGLHGWMDALFTLIVVILRCRSCWLE